VNLPHLPAAGKPSSEVQDGARDGDLCHALGLLPMPSSLGSHRLPRLEVRGPATTGLLDDVEEIRRFRDWLLNPSGVSEPTALVVNLEGRFPTPSVLLELVLPLARAVRSGAHGPLALVVCTEDEGTRTVLRALAEANNLSFYLAPSAAEIEAAEPVGSLTPTDLETLRVIRGLGGRTTVASFAKSAGLEVNAATNRLTNLHHKGFVQRVDRSRGEGRLFLDPRAALPNEDPADPTSADFAVPEAVRSDVRALAEMQAREAGPLLADAWLEFLDTHRGYLAEEHERLADLARRGDHEGLAEVGRRYAKKIAQARRKGDR
jgi:hypothetical protein